MTSDLNPTPNLTDRNQRLKAARALINEADLPPGSLNTAVSLLEDMVIEVDQVRGEVEAARAEAQSEAAAGAEARADYDRLIESLCRLIPEEYDSEDAAEAIVLRWAEDAAKATAERDTARGIAVELEQQLGEIEARAGRLTVEYETQFTQSTDPAATGRFHAAERFRAIIDVVTDPEGGERTASEVPAETVSGLTDVEQAAATALANETNCRLEDVDEDYYVPADFADEARAAVAAVRPLLAAETALELGRDCLENGLNSFLDRLIGPANTARLLANAASYDRARFDEVVDEKNQAIEAWGKAMEERETARRTAEHYRAMKCAVCGKRAAYVNAAGEVIGWGCADGEECVDPPGPRQAYRDALAIADTALGRWPYDGSPEAQAHRRNLRKLAAEIEESRRGSENDRSATPVQPAGGIVVNIDPPHGNVGEAFAAGRASVLSALRRRGGNFR